MISKNLVFLILLVTAKGIESDIIPGRVGHGQYDSSPKSSYNGNTRSNYVNSQSEFHAAVNTNSKETGDGYSEDAGDGSAECVPHECDGKIIPATPSPIHVNTAELTPTNEGPITAIFGQKGYLNMTNTGNTVWTTPIGDIGRKTTLAGGILEGKKYFAYEGRLIWNCDESRPAASIEDNKWTPLESLIVYQSTEYESFNEALKSNDKRAVVILSYSVRVEKICYSVPFNQFLNYVKRIENTGDYVDIPVSMYSAWFVSQPKTKKTIAYDGSYTDSETGVQYYTALIIKVPLTVETPCISHEQFEQFKHLRNKNGRFYCNAQKTYPTCDREVFSIEPMTIILSLK